MEYITRNNRCSQVRITPNRIHHVPLKKGAQMGLDDLPLTMSVPAFGSAVYNLSPDGSYRAANAGEIPVVKVRRRKRVPVRIALQPILGANPGNLTGVVARLLAAAQLYP
jgi:hypothetical protein